MPASNEWPKWVKDYPDLRATLNEAVEHFQRAYNPPDTNRTPAELESECHAIISTASELKQKVQKVWRFSHLQYENNSTRRKAVKRLCSSLKNDAVVKGCMAGMTYPEIDQALAGLITHMREIEKAARAQKPGGRPPKALRDELILSIFSVAWEHGIPYAERKKGCNDQIFELADSAIRFAFNDKEKRPGDKEMRELRDLARSRFQNKDLRPGHHRLRYWADIAGVREELSTGKKSEI